MYKIILKILANRLKSGMSFLIDETQTTFTSEKQITDGVLIANQVVEWLKKKIHSFVLKLDFHKAYDIVRWFFMKYVMESM